MKNEMIVFENQEFGKLTVVEIDGKPWFIGREVAAMLGYKNTPKAIKDHCKYAKLLNNNETALIEIAPRGIQIINEKDIYRLIMRSKLPSAERFQDWVCDVVLPSIRKTGSYSIPKNDINPALVPKWEIEGDAIQRTLAKFKAPEHIIATETAKYILQLGGPDLRNIVGSLPCSQNILEEEIMLEPTELGKHFGLSGKEMNQKLQQLSLQFHNGMEWTPTKEGSKFSQRHAWSNRGKSGYNYKWNVNKIKQLMKTRVPCLF